MTVLSFFLAFVGFALLVILHEAGHFAAAKAVGMRVERFALFFPPLIARKQVGETEYAIGLVPLGGYVKISGMNPDENLPEEVRDRAYHAQPVWKRVVVIAAGPAVNLVLALVLLVAFFAFVGPVVGATTTVGAIAPGLPADGEVHVGDRVLAVDDVRGPEPIDLSRAISKNQCPGFAYDGCEASAAVDVQVERPDGSIETLTLTPVYDATVERTRLGFSFEEKHDPLPVGEAVSTAATVFWRISKATVELPARLLDPVVRKQISGVVGSYEVTRQNILHKPGNVILILGIISLSLAIINLFPFLPLDGGHIFWAVVEKIRRRPVSLATMERASVIGLMLLVPLFVLGLTNDIGRLVGEGFGPPR